MKGKGPGNQGGNSNSPEKISIVGKVSIEYDPKALNHITDAIRNQAATQENAGNASDGIANRAVGQQEKANSIARWALWVSGFALVATIVIIVLNYKAINTAGRTLEEVKNEFKSEKETFLQAYDFNFDKFEPRQPIVINFKITNIGESSVRILKKAFGVTFRTSPFPREEMKYFDKPMPTLFLAKESPLPQFIGNGPGETVIVSDSIYSKVNSQIWFIFVYGKIKYENLATHQIKEYIFQIQYIRMSAIEFTYAYKDNDNIEVKDTVE